MSASVYDHPAWKSRPDQFMRPGGWIVTEQALACCDLLPGMRVLDVGCGTGRSLWRITENQQMLGIGIDISANLLQQAEYANASLCFARANGEQLPFASLCMDLILSECTLSIFCMEQALAEYTRVLRPGGCVVINDVYARKEDGVSFLRQLPSETCIGGAMTQRMILDSMQQFGLRVTVFQDCSEHLKDFPTCNLSAASGVSSFDLYLAAAKAKLGYYFLVAQKV